MHNGKYNTEQFRLKQLAKNDRLFGPIKDHTKNCIICDKEYVYTGRQYTKQYEASKFCSRSCANNRRDWWKDNATSYTTIAFHNWKRECILCGFDKIVEVHHLDEDRTNNEPRNLVPLCPNHHQMVHSKWRNEVIAQIELIVEKKWGIGASGNTSPLHGEVKSSILLSSTILAG